MTGRKKNKECSQSILILTSWIGENFQFLVEYVRQCVCEMKRKWLRRPFRLSMWEELGGGGLEVLF